MQSGSTIEMSHILIIATDIWSHPWAFLVSSILINFKTLSLWIEISSILLAIQGKKVGKELEFCRTEHCWTKRSLKMFALFVGSVINNPSSKSGGILQIFLLLISLARVDQYFIGPRLGLESI